ncbi:MAG TPA: hypothetical protein DCO83_02605 [Mucilaginibacter sp.]|jgi:hypothetical protein|nr:hypothetical protein [Mucilaginibacter sp.]
MMNIEYRILNDEVKKTISSFGIRYSVFDIYFLAVKVQKNTPLCSIPIILGVMFNMKKSLTLNLVFSLSAILLVFTFTTCKKSSTGGGIAIVGIWTNKAIWAKDIVQQYNFRSNDSVEFYEYKIDTITAKILGYGSKAAGKYKIENSTLTMYNMVSFSNPSNSFGPLIDLVQGSINANEIYTIALNSQKNQLFLYFTCPLNASCIPSPIIYYKQ